MADAFSNYKNSMNQAIDSYNKAIDSGLNASALGYQKTKEDAAASMKKANASAQTAQLQSINPYGYDAQNLAALGLNRSGVSESSRVSAGNAYQQALSDARQSYDSTVKEANLAQQQDVLNAASDKGKYAADAYQNIASTEINYNEWAQEYALKKRELEEQVATNKITRAQAQAELDIYRKYAAQQAAADLANTKAQTAKYNRS